MAGEGTSEGIESTLTQSSSKGPVLFNIFLPPKDFKQEKNNGETSGSQDPRPLRSWDLLHQAAVDQAQQLPPFHSYHLQQLLRRLPHKAAGPDGISYDFLRHLPYPAVEKLAESLTTMQREGNFEPPTLRSSQRTAKWKGPLR